MPGLLGGPGGSKYDVGDEIGHGAFSEVHRARDRATGATVALKTMYLVESGEPPVHYTREAEALQSVQHPSVVKLLGTHKKGYTVSLVLECCDASLWKVLQRLQGAALSAAATKAVMQQILQALAATHGAGFVHRDVGPTNVLIAPDGSIRLADYGHARRPGAQQPGGSAGSGSMTPHVGTLWYKAPELLFCSRSYDAAIDIWSAGCLFAELITGQPLFGGRGDIDQIRRFAAALGSIDEQTWPGVRDLPDWGKLILPVVPAPAFAGVVPGASPAALELLQGMLKYNPEHRLTAEQALGSAYFREEEPLPAGRAAVKEEAQAALRRSSSGMQDDSDDSDYPAPLPYVS